MEGGWEGSPGWPRRLLPRGRALSLKPTLHGPYTAYPLHRLPTLTLNPSLALMLPGCVQAGRLRIIQKAPIRPCSWSPSQGRGVPGGTAFGFPGDHSVEQRKELVSGSGGHLSPKPSLLLLGDLGCCQEASRGPISSRMRELLSPAPWGLGTSPERPVKAMCLLVPWQFWGGAGAAYQAGKEQLCQYRVSVPRCPHTGDTPGDRRSDGDEGTDPV